MTSSTVEHANMDGKRLHGPLETPGIFSGVNLFLIEVTPAGAVHLVPRANSLFVRGVRSGQSVQPDVMTNMEHRFS